MVETTKRVLMTGATGYVADQIIPTFRERYETVLIDVKKENRRGESVEGVRVADLIHPERGGYSSHFEGVDAVVHLAYKKRSGAGLDDFFDEKENVEMAYNVFRTALDAGVKRVVMASSNHAADWYEHNLIHERKLDSIDPYALPLSDNFYGWAKATYEHMGFLFANGVTDFLKPGGHVASVPVSERLEVVMVRIGSPHELNGSIYRSDPATYKRYLGTYISRRDISQLFVKSIETPCIDNEHGVPWQVVYGISNNTRAFWSLTNARRVLGYEPQDDSEVKYAKDIQSFLVGEAGARGVGRVSQT